MSEQDFDLKRRHIEEQYAARKEGADAYRDQELARLFHDCEWTQEKIAAHLGKKKVWVSQRLVFGRFLKEFATGEFTSAVSNLTERRFRGHYQTACRAYPGKHQSEEKERKRFEHVLNALRHGIPQGRAALVDKPGIRNAIVAAMEDGQWYTVQQLLATVEESLPGVLPEQVRTAITHLGRTPPAGKKVESKSIGRKSQYRLVSLKAARQEGGEAESVLVAVYEEAAPLIDELEHWGRASKWAQAPGELLKLATKLRRLFESRLSPEHA